MRVVLTEMKAEIIAKTLVKVHSTEHFNQEEKMQDTRLLYRIMMMRMEMNTLFSKTEFNNALRKLGQSTSGKYYVCYSMLENLKGKGVLFN